MSDTDNRQTIKRGIEKQNKLDTEIKDILPVEASPEGYGFTSRHISAIIDRFPPKSVEACRVLHNREKQTNLQQLMSPIEAVDYCYTGFEF